MAYFSNGTEGMALDEECADCVHNPDDPDVPLCPVRAVHQLFNYNQIANERAGHQELRDAMTMLVDNEARNNPPGQPMCRMRIERNAAIARIGCPHVPPHHEGENCV